MILLVELVVGPSVALIIELVIRLDGWPVGWLVGWHTKGLVERLVEMFVVGLSVVLHLFINICREISSATLCPSCHDHEQPGKDLEIVYERSIGLHTALKCIRCCTREEVKCVDAVNPLPMNATHRLRAMICSRMSAY